MSKLISYCGLDCSTCPAYLATQSNDDNARKDVAAMWSKMYNAEIKPEDINCNGCTSEVEPLFNHCKVCEYRACARAKGVENCAFCDEYACDKLQKFFEMAPEAKANLEEIRGNPSE